MVGKSGLGQRGQDKVSKSANELFRKTDNIGIHTDTNTHLQDDTSLSQPSVRKQYVLSFELSEKLRKCAFEERRKEVDIVREALEAYLSGRTQ